MINFESFGLIFDVLTDILLVKPVSALPILLEAEID